MKNGNLTRTLLRRSMRRLACSPPNTLRRRVGWCRVGQATTRGPAAMEARASSW